MNVRDVVGNVHGIFQGGVLFCEQWVVSDERWAVTCEEGQIFSDRLSNILYHGILPQGIKYRGLIIRRVGRINNMNAILWAMNNENRTICTWL